MYIYRILDNTRANYIYAMFFSRSLRALLHVLSQLIRKHDVLRTKVKRRLLVHLGRWCFEYAKQYSIYFKIICIKIKDFSKFHIIVLKSVCYVQKLKRDVTFSKVTGVHTTQQQGGNGDGYVRDCLPLGKNLNVTFFKTEKDLKCRISRSNFKRFIYIYFCLLSKLPPS